MTMLNFSMEVGMNSRRHKSIKTASIKSLYMSKYGSVYVFDDLQNLKTKDPVYRLMDDIAVKGRHQLINWFVTFQTAYRLNANIISNCDKLFIRNYRLQMTMFGIE